MKRKCPWCRQRIETVNGIFVLHRNKSGAVCQKSGLTKNG